MISYHSFISSASSKVEEVKDTVTQKAQDTVNSAVSKVQAVITQETQSTASSISESASSVPEDNLEEFVTTKAVIKSFSYEHAFLHNGASNSHHYWLLDTKNSVACLINTYESTACLLALPSDDFNTGVLLDYGATSFDLHSNTLSSGLSVKYGSDGAYFFSASTVKAAFSDLDSIRSFYDFRSLNTASSISSSGVRSEGKTPTSSSSDSSATSINLDGLLDAYYKLPAYIDYDECYVMHAKDYDVYYVIYYTTNTVRSFSTNGDLSIEVGKIVSGNLKDGMVVRMPYDGGWNEYLWYTNGDKSNLSVRIGNNDWASKLTKTTTAEVQKVLQSDDYHDWKE